MKLFLLRLVFIITGLNAVINSHHVTTVTWNQTQKAYVCIYNDHTLLFCKDFAAGNNTVTLGAKGPLVDHVDAGNTLTLQTITTGANTEVSAPVMRRYELWMPLINLTAIHT